ncbi:MAG: single-stranded DNA-binding protein [Bacteroidetes bacterium RIFOXYA12_FULL_35_11]|nr:MAG: single-stranded DNA-binding protein [Bacteroidetes bacterium GWF2_35_48]OFY81026.1 MAG: single-stranded DNA-binding protein [Bacteroidetes bacterium RIFOXYA12_FULL_35_11]OFY92206.1 MAG: single-stranded DNA-binding protein [Bacteroidetes bacterium RIFOXYB2_FULL_35_7]OFZ03329.1 MAG: single-stranded DNA-binding protein [Bacteroidetes bacterium RIFOXYC12_FULL_35_7]HBX49945.1 single-stranded DNA-binding protein [Bacteroidales bacterium]
MSVNKVILVGNVGKDPEVRHLDSGVVKTNFTLATGEVYKNKNGEQVRTTEWHNLVTWRQQAEFAEKNIKKGMLIYVEGKITSRSWDDKDGNKRYITEIVVDTIQLLGKKEGAGENQNPEQKTEETSETQGLSSVPEDDLPF